MSDSPEVQSRAGPGGTGDYEVTPGECTSSIAFEQGHFWETIWNHPENRDLKEARRDARFLMPGVRVTIPPLRRRQKSGATGQKQRFRRKGVPARLRVVFKLNHEPRDHQRYDLSIDDGCCKEGSLDRDGLLDVPICPKARKALVRVGEGEKMTEHVLRLGALDPVTELSGAGGRLANLGYSCGAQGRSNEATRTALRMF